MPGDPPFGHDIGTNAALSSGTVSIQIVYGDGSVDTVYTAFCNSADDYDTGWSMVVSGEAGSSATVYAYVEGIQYSSYTITFQ